MTLLEREEDIWNSKEKRITPPCYITLPFYVLFGLEKTIHFLATYHLKNLYYTDETYVEGFASLLPILDESERTRCKEWIKLYLKPKELESEEAIAPFLIAMDLGMKEELLSIVESWTTRNYSNSEYRKNIIFQLENSEIVKRNMRKIGHLLNSAEEVKQWLSITQYSDLEWVALSIKEVFNSSSYYRDLV